MTPTWLAFVGIAGLLMVAFVLALIDVAFDYFSKISIRTYREESWKTEYLTSSLEDPMSFLLPLRIGLQGAFTATTVLVTMLFITAGTPQPLLMAFAAMLGAFLVFREAVPNIIARKNPERVLLTLLPRTASTRSSSPQSAVRSRASSASSWRRVETKRS